MQDKASEIEEFNRLKPNLQRIWADLQADPSYKHTSVIVPSLSVDQEELAKVTGASFYEERLMFALIRLRSRNARVIYLTSQPVHPEIVDYYLQMLEGVPVSHARQRLSMMSVYDGSSRPLTEKILERPRLVARLRNALGDAARAYLTCYNSTVLERRLAVQLGIPLNGVDPSLLHFGTKSGSREIFKAANVNLPTGFENLQNEDDIVRALLDLAKQRPGLKRAVVKLDEGFSGEGNGLFTYPAELSDAAIRAALQDLKWSSGSETYRSFLRKYTAMGGIVEEMLEADEVRSPSVQMRIHPDGRSVLVSSHEQVLGGSTGQVYLGCRFPASEEYRLDLQEQAERIGAALSERGVIGRFGIDFLVSRKQGGDWAAHAIEINLRMGGTTPPYHALEFLTGGRLDNESGLFCTLGSDKKYYSATDNLKSPSYHGLLPEDLFEIITRHGLGYRHATGTGVLFYMIGALSQYGKIGMTAIGNSPQQAQELFDRTVDILDAECEGGHGVPAPLFDRHVTME
ncbi:MAG: peptide ligase PGM1-related protein [Woeseia sp.]